MLENRSFDAMLGMLRPSDDSFDGLKGTEENIWHRANDTPLAIQVWTDPVLNAQSVTTPDPDPGELFDDIRMQIHGMAADGTPDPGPADMSGFVDNYMRQPATSPAPDPYSIMHYFTENHVPVISQLARAFGVSDRWHASAPCQTWPNRFFAHTGTANGYINNSPTHFPYEMETVFNRMASAGKTWGIYFHDVPQSATLSRLWLSAAGHFHFFDDFARDARAGRLPAYSFIEPRYFADPVLNQMPNDEHPPHNLAYGEQLIAEVYNAIRGGPAWKQTLLLVTYDEHGGCYDHVPPPPAVPPGDSPADTANFGFYGVRVPAVIISPYVKPGSVIRPAGPLPFDHTSIIATLRGLFGFQPLTRRDAVAPSLLDVLEAEPINDGPASITAPAIPAAVQQVARLAATAPNDMQKALGTAAAMLPTAGADVAAHIARLTQVPDVAPDHRTVQEAATAVAAHVKAFLGIL
jgi:phospholipase C